MKNLYTHILFALCTILGACTTSDEGVSNDTGSVIRFSAGILASKSQIITPLNQVDLFTDFGVYAYEQTDPIDYNDNATQLMSRKKISYDSEFKSWTYSNFVKWPKSGLGAEFFAYAPYEHDSFTTQMNTADGELELLYTHPEHIDDQVDIMVADYKSQTETSSNVGLTFNHKFAAIGFKIYGMGELTLQSIGFKGGYESGTIAMGADTCVWRDRVYNESRLFDIKFDDEALSADTPISTGDRGDYMMMIPLENVLAASSLVATFTNGLGNVEEVEIHTDDVEMWEANKIYTYTLTLIGNDEDIDVENLTFGVYVNIEPWITTEDGELSNESDPSYIDNRRELSNCYMFDSTLKDQVFYIPIDERIYEFWSGYNGYTDEALSNYTLSQSDEWYPDIIWYTGDVYGLANSTTASSTGYNFCNIIGEEGGSQIKFERLDPESDEYQNIYRNEKVTASGCTTNFVTQNAKAIMKITLPCESMGIEDANIFVAVKKRINGIETILWSWHFWITDYNPNITPTSTDIEGNYTVKNGNVHRYIDSSTQTYDLWDNMGMYRDKYMMDRNIGMFADNKRYGAYGDLMYYQFGRKEPFPYNSTSYYTSGANFSTISYTAISSNTGGKSMSTAIQAPTTRYRGNYASYVWLSDDVISNSDCLWHDAGVPYSFITDITCQQKSLFDPSPLGWKIPMYEAWSGIIEAINNGVDIKYNALSLSTSSPEDYATCLVYGGYAHFTTSGYYTMSDTSSPDDIATSIYDSSINMWTSSPYSTYKYYGRAFMVTIDYDDDTHNISVDDSYYARNGAMPIRCIQE